MSVLQDQATRGDGRIPTSLVGSYAQPNWLIDRERLRGRFPPRVRATELWRVDPGYLEEAQDMQARPDAARQYGVDVLNEATSGVNGTVAVHICFGYADLSTDEVEAGATVNHRIRRAFPYVPAERLVAAPDCGMKYLPRGVDYGKLEALVQGAGLASQPA
jgi:methionine synthase II (cobalamin-independent)